MTDLSLIEIEQPIMACWGITEDINFLFEHVCEADKLDQDEIANALLGLRVLYDIKFNALFAVYERLHKEAAARNGSTV